MAFSSTPRLPVDLSHHLSTEARMRRQNPMKAIWKLARRKPNMISLANGDPHFSLYPLRKIDFEVVSVADENQDPVAALRSLDCTSSHTFTSYIDEPSALPLKTALQYSNGAGLPEAQKAVTTLTEYYHSPPDHACIMTLGNSDGNTKCFRLLGDHGDHFLADEFSFSSLTNAPLSHGVKWVSVKIDEGGLIPEDLERVLDNWDDRRGRRPHVLYTVPCGQNPTGSTLTIERRRKIYNLAQRFDLIIIEDDPYYFLQYGSSLSDPIDISGPFIPSFLSMDVDGRVMRIDSFSKIIAPGMRLGWITCNHTFYEHLISYTDSSTQHPHAFGQVFITEMLSAHGWKLTGFDRWVRSLRAEYWRRRNFFLDLFEQEVASTQLASASVPEAGMFVWVRVDVEKHPRYQRASAEWRKSGGVAQTNVSALMDEFFEKLLDEGLVVMPASIFAVPGDPRYDCADSPLEDRLNYLRVTFAGTEEVMRKGLSILGCSLRAFFAEQK